MYLFFLLHSSYLCLFFSQRYNIKSHLSSTSPEKRIFLLYTLLLVAQSSYQFFHRNKILFAGFHILQHCFAFIHFVLSYDSYERNTLGIGIAHLLLHLCRIREDFRTDTCRTNFCQHTHGESSFFITKVYEHQFRTVHCFLRIKFQLIQYIENTVCTKRACWQPVRQA